MPLTDDAWLHTCTVPNHQQLESDLQQLRELVALNGFELLEGDFTRRDGTRSRFHLKPNNVDRLLTCLRQARENEQHNTPT